MATRYPTKCIEGNRSAFGHLGALNSVSATRTAALGYFRGRPENKRFAQWGRRRRRRQLSGSA